MWFSIRHKTVYSTLLLKCPWFTVSTVTYGAWQRITEPNQQEMKAKQCFFFCLAGVRPLEATHGHPNSSWHPTLPLLLLHSFLWWIYKFSLAFPSSSLAAFTLKLSIFLWNYESNSLQNVTLSCLSVTVSGWCTGGVKALCLTGS